MTNIFIAGLGLMGGSLAYAARGFMEAQITGFDRDPEVMLCARERGAIDHICTDIAEELPKADLVLLCVKPGNIIDFIRQYKDYFKKGAVISDIGGVKRDIIKEAEKLDGVSFVGGHPMAGRENSGFEYADGSLFKGANYLLVPLKSTGEDALGLMKRFAGHIGCVRIIVTDADTHDRMIAYTSQLMHILAGAIAESQLYLDSKGFEGNSFMGTTRVARLDAEMWTELFLRNSDDLVAVIHELRENLKRFEEILTAGDAGALEDKLKGVTNRKELWNNTLKGMDVGCQNLE